MGESYLLPLFKNTNRVFTVIKTKLYRYTKNKLEINITKCQQWFDSKGEFMGEKCCLLLSKIFIMWSDIFIIKIK